MKTEIGTEVCVIGGGPAGSSFAHRLAALGHRVLLIEQSEFPRSHVGESLPPSILSSLDLLGLRDRIESAAFLRPDRALLRWSEQTEYLNFQQGQRGFQVDRGQFDLILLDAAKRAGVRVLQPATARPPVRGKAGGWNIPVLTSRDRFSVNARFLAIATGKKPLLGGHRKRCSASTIALYAYWRDTSIRGPETRVEAGREHWFWGAPLPDGTFNATVFVDPTLTRMAGLAGLKPTYLSLLSQSKLLRECLDGQLVGDILACNASSYLDENSIDEDWIKIGESCFAIDPLSSQGVQAAITSALQGSVVVHTLLTLPENSKLAIDYYCRRQADTSDYHRSIAAKNYAKQLTFEREPFWQKRAFRHHVSPAKEYSIGLPMSVLRTHHVRKSDAATFCEIPCIRGDVITSIRALHHPNLDRPVGFLDSIEVAQLLDVVSGERVVEDIVSLWSMRLGVQRSFDILLWMVSKGILIPTLVLSQDERQRMV